MKATLLAILLLAFQAGLAQTADLIITNGKIATMARPGEYVQAVAVKDGIVLGTGSSAQIVSKYKSSQTKIIDAKGRTVVPGINDSHIHIIREGLHFNSELRWDGVKTLARAMQMLKEQATRTPEGVWIKVIGGWNEFQFEEKRQPTLAEINAAVPDKPVFITYLYGKAFLNKKGIEVLGYNSTTKYEGSLVELDQEGNPTGMLFAKETPKAIYTTLGLTTKLSREERLNSTLQYYRELNRFGITSAADAAGGSQNYPSDYSVALQLAREGKLNVRTSYFLFAQQKGRELEDYQQWVQTAMPNKNDHMLLANGYDMEGAGENLVATAADFENFLEPRTILSDQMEADLEPVIRLLVKNRWAFRLHATYGESIERMLAVFEKVNKDIPFNGLRWFRPRRNDYRRSVGPRQETRRRRGRAVPDVLPGRALREALRQNRSPVAPDPENARDGHSRRHGYGRHAHIHLQSLDGVALAANGANNRRAAILAERPGTRPVHCLRPIHVRQCVVHGRRTVQGQDYKRNVCRYDRADRQLFRC